ncbi:uncharacterized protein [Equus asinus]|uniref:uncharacterized protein n=1 Tax=Equus asinus TaxID=9793 RepID=UPI0038F76AE5
MMVWVKGTRPCAGVQYVLVINKEQVKLRGGLNRSWGESSQEFGGLQAAEERVWGRGMRRPITDDGDEERSQQCHLSRRALPSSSGCSGGSRQDTPGPHAFSKVRSPRPGPQLVEPRYQGRTLEVGTWVPPRMGPGQRTVVEDNFSSFPGLVASAHCWGGAATAEGSLASDPSGAHRPPLLVAERRGRVRGQGWVQDGRSCGHLPGKTVPTMCRALKTGQRTKQTRLPALRAPPAHRGETGVMGWAVPKPARSRRQPQRRSAGHSSQGWKQPNIRQR